MWMLSSAALRALRRKKAWTAEQAAKMSGVSTRAIYRYEARDTRVHIGTVRALAKAYGKKPEDIGRPIVDEDAMPSATLAPMSRLAKKVHKERAAAAPKPPLVADGEEIAWLTAKRLHDVFTAHAMFAEQRFAIAGRVEAQHRLTDAEASALGTRPGMGARFHVAMPIADGEDLGVTVHAVDSDHVRALLDLAGGAVTLVARVHVAESAGFAIFMSKKPRPWTLVVTRLVEQG